MNTPILIASYPRSGSTYLRFLLSNILWPDREHDISSINKHIPTIENKKEVLEGILDPPFYKTHGLRSTRNAVFLHRHIGDCLISEFHFHTTYYEYEGTIEEFIEGVKYGESWRNMIDHYFPCPAISFEELVADPTRVLKEVFALQGKDVDKAIKLCTFDKLKEHDKMFFRSGKNGQWDALSDEAKDLLIEKNWKHLKILGYKI